MLLELSHFNYVLYGEFSSQFSEDELASILNDGTCMLLHFSFVDMPLKHRWTCKSIVLLS